MSPVIQAGEIWTVEHSVTGKEMVVVIRHIEKNLMTFVQLNAGEE